jgi:hypothetical protein
VPSGPGVPLPIRVHRECAVFGRYVGHLGQVAQSYEILNILRLGRRFSIRFRPP